MASLKDKVIIITGASSGIGAATALHLAEYGPKLVLAARREEILKDIADQCIQKGLASEKVLVVKCDVCKEEDLNNLVEKTLEKFSQIDVLVNNAGSGKYKGIVDTSPELFDEIMGILVKAPFFLSKLCIPHLLKTQGSIINVSSNLGQRAFPAAIAYSISKAALDHFTRTLAVELVTKKVRVNSVNPGMTVTNFQRAAGMPEEVYQQYLSKQKDLQPLTGGAVDPYDVAKAIKFFASDESASTTGELLFIDGGRHAIGPK